MTPEQEAKERKEFEKWEYEHYGPMGLIDCHNIAIKVWLERARLDIHNIGSHDLGDFYKE